MRTIAVVNQQGGSAKTTMAVSLAATLAEQGEEILLVDLDPNAENAASNFFAGREATAAETLSVETTTPGVSLGSPGVVVNASSKQPDVDPFDFWRRASGHSRRSPG